MGIKKFLIFVFLAFPLFLSGVLSAESVTDTQAQPGVVINEIQTNGVGSGKTAEEFVELVNVSNAPVALDGWKLQYITSTGATTKTFFTFAAGFAINPNGSVLLCPDTYVACASPTATYIVNSSFTGLGSTGGSVVLLNNVGERVDLVGWGSNANTKFETAPASTPADGQRIQRKLVNNKPADTNNNSLDFEPLATPTPINLNNAVVTPPNGDEDPVPTPTPTPSPTPTPTPEPEPEPTPTPTPTPAETGNTQNTPEAPIVASYLPILLNELYIDPVSPETDSKNEWVELYNPNDTAQDLLGYTVYAGETFAYHHSFTSSTIIPAHGYLIITSGDTSIALANSGGAVKITDPSGQVLGQTTYDAAKAGEAWAKNDSGTWQWSTTPTPNLQNIISIAVDPVPVITAAVKKATKTTTTTAVKKATTTPKPTATKSAAATKTTKVKAATTEANEPAVIAAPSPLPLWLLAVLGTLAVLYSAYEYRFEIANKIYQYKQYRAARKANR